ncbi:MAG: DoxX family protein [Ilumatobacteraceae bacterium]
MTRSAVGLLVTRPRLGWSPLVVRLITGVVLVVVSLSKFTRHESLVDSFERYGIPAPDLAVYVAGTVELVGGLLLVVGLLVRLAAALVAVNMAVALATGGRVDVDLYHVGLGSLLLGAALFLVWAGAGPWSVDERLATR